MNTLTTPATNIPAIPSTQTIPEEMPAKDDTLLALEIMKKLQIEDLATIGEQLALIDKLKQWLRIIGWAAAIVVCGLVFLLGTGIITILF